MVYGAAKYRFPPEVIRHAVWLYVRFTLSIRDVEEDRPGREGGLPEAASRLTGRTGPGSGG